MTGPRGDLAPDVGRLGKKVQRKPAPPQPVRVPTEDANRHVYKGPDGKFFTTDPWAGAARR